MWPQLRTQYSSQERLYGEVNIVLVGKYTDFTDSYASVVKALEHSAFRVQRKLVLQVSGAGLADKLFADLILHMCLQWVESSNLETETQESNPAKYHDAWRALVGAGCVFSIIFTYFPRIANVDYCKGVFWYQVASVEGVQKA